MSPFLRKATRPYASRHPCNNPWAWYVILSATSAGSQSLQKESNRLDVYRRHMDVIINPLAPGRFKFDFRYVIFKLILVNGGWGISYKIALRWMPIDLTDDKSTAWCRQATLPEPMLTHLFPNSNDAAIEVWEWIRNFISRSMSPKWRH